MKCFRCCLCLLLCFALSSGVFSVIANAEEVYQEGYAIDARMKLAIPDGTVPSKYDVSKTLYPGNGTTEMNQATALGSYTPLTPSSGVHTLTTHWKIYYTTGKSLAKDNDNAITFYIDSFYYSMMHTVYSTGKQTYYRNIDSLRALVTYSDGGAEYFSVTEYSVNGALLSAEFEFTPTDDVVSVEFIATQELNLNIAAKDSLIFYIGEIDDDDTHYVSVDVPSKSEGLLSGIFDKVTDTVENLKNGFKDTVDNIKNGFKDTVDSIKELPEKIGEKIKDAISNLFVPDDEFIVSYKTRIEALLSEKLGAIYQVIDVTFDSWDRIRASDENNSIEFPVTTIQITNDTSFSFGGWDVPIVPQGFEFLATAVKSICGIVCTILFVNGLRKRYDEVMGVEK